MVGDRKKGKENLKDGECSEKEKTKKKRATTQHIDLTGRAWGYLQGEEGVIGGDDCLAAAQPQSF
ncbi:hypothetical protein OUZ56_002859 [Daphnia magna]|uniref:Uncharacterized protein n=1 Tax=Daphnia magna TaxID=35525 RepID=A0ABR0A705_9CRUS|nr:hypothetical protein OUZ56_002859 [Daphnia magna]